MAFIREYALMSGDPFRFRLPKAIRKFKPGKFLKKALPIASAFVPGLQPVALASGIFGGLARRKGPLAAVGSIGRGAIDSLQAASDATGIDPNTLIGFARSYGMQIMGDPFPYGGSTSRRKSAGAGPKAKAQKKAVKRAVKMAPPTKGGGIDWGAIAGAATQILPHVAGAIRGPGGVMKQVDPSQYSGFAFPGTATTGAFRTHFGGGRRRSMNPGNVKALRRSIRRVEGFNKMVQRVYKAMPKLRPASLGGGARRGARGHKRGCRCVACR